MGDYFPTLEDMQEIVSAIAPYVVYGLGIGMVFSMIGAVVSVVVDLLR